MPRFLPKFRKYLFSKHSRLKKSILAFCLLAVIIGSLVPNQQARAADVDVKKNLLKSLSLFVMLNSIFSQTGGGYQGFQTGLSGLKVATFGADIPLAFVLPALLMDAGNYIFDFSLSEPFKTSYTNPSNNRVIEVGWTLMRDLTNMLFILGLAYIGLATALNFASFDTKKTFARLIVIALLINFTPVICGVIVDLSNVIFRYLAKNMDFSGLKAVMVDASKDIPSSMSLLSVGKTGLKAWALLLFMFFSGLALLLFGLLFLLRHLVIWILVIFSPLAFFAWAFDSTKKYFSMWWSQFIQWCFIAVSAAFLLFLGSHMLRLSENEGLLSLAIENDPSGGSWAALAPYVLVTFFMYLSYTATLAASPAITKTVIDSAKKWGKKGGKYVGKRAAVFAGGAAPAVVTEGVAKAKAGVTEAKEAGRGRAAQMGAAIGGFIAGGAVGAATPEGRERARGQVVGVLEKAHLLRRGAYEKWRGKRLNIKEIEQRLKSKSSEQLQEIAEAATLSEGGLAERAVAVKILQDRKDFKPSTPSAGREAISVAQSVPGIDVSDLAKQNPLREPYTNRKAVEKYMKEMANDEIKISIAKDNISYKGEEPEKIIPLGKVDFYLEAADNPALIQKEINEAVSKARQRGETPENIRKIREDTRIQIEQRIESVVNKKEELEINSKQAIKEKLTERDPRLAQTPAKLEQLTQETYANQQRERLERAASDKAIKDRLEKLPKSAGRDMATEALENEMIAEEIAVKHQRIVSDIHTQGTLKQQDALMKTLRNKSLPKYFKEVVKEDEDPFLEGLTEEQKVRGKAILDALAELEASPSYTSQQDRDEEERIAQLMREAKAKAAAEEEEESAS